MHKNSIELIYYVQILYVRIAQKYIQYFFVFARHEIVIIRNML